MDDLDELLEEMLCKTYNQIINNEERILKSMGALSLKEFHTLDMVHNCERNACNSLGTIAQRLGITLSTCTINVDRLIQKGYLQKVKLNGDKRVSYISVTSNGLTLLKRRDILHHKVVRSAIKNLSASEKVALLSAVNKMDF